MAGKVPGKAKVVVIGGGIVGTSIAYHLTKRGVSDVLLLERDQLTSGTTWHAAGLVGQLRPSHNLTKLASYAVELYPRLEEETGQATGFKQVGSITLAQTPERFHELKRSASMANGFGVEVRVLTPAQVAKLNPVIRVDDIVGAVHMPKDGQTNPIDTTQALARGARMGGATIVEKCTATKLVKKGQKIVAVETDQGTVEAEQVVLACGMWTRQIAASVGLTVPLQAAEHMYIVTEPMEGLPADLPVLRDYDSYIYIKEDAGKLLVGGFEPVAKPWQTDGIPDDISFLHLPEDWDHFQILMDGALNRVPAMEHAGVRTFFNGPESFTPDNRYHMGRAPGFGNLFVAAGMNSIGIASGPGIGKALADWIVDGESPLDLADVDLMRAEPFQRARDYLADRTVETLGLLYAMHWPYFQPTTARGARRLPYHDRCKAAGAVFGDVQGWERPLYYAEGDEPREMAYGYGRQSWHDATAREARATREAVALYDLSTFAKFEVQGADAMAVLNRLCTANVDVEVGKAVYTQMLNHKGGIEADLTVTRLAETRFMVVTGTAVRQHDRSWIERNIPAEARVALTDVTSGYAVLGLMGPKSRELLAGLTAADLSPEAFPFGGSRELEVAYAPARAQRTSYVGELGYELYVPTEFAQHLHERLCDAGEAFGLRLAGIFCQDALRMEKGFKHWGHDIGPDDTPLEAGLSFAVSWDKPGGFIGLEALTQKRAAGLDRRLVNFTLPGCEPGAPLLLHEEPIWRDGMIVGTTTSGGYAFTLGCPISMGYVKNRGGKADRDWIMGGTYEIEVAGERYAATPSLSAPFVPKGARMRA